MALSGLMFFFSSPILTLIKRVGVTEILKKLGVLICACGLLLFLSFKLYFNLKFKRAKKISFFSLFFLITDKHVEAK